MRAIRVTLLAFAGALLLACGVSAQAGAADFVYGDRYFDTLKAAVDGASSTVTAYLYLFSLYTGNSNALPLRLADALAAASRRGVRVDVVLNRQFAAAEEEITSLNDRNRRAAEYMNRNGVHVFFEASPAVLHAKTVVIDESVVLLGSSNWSQKSLTDNIETNLLVRDTALARTVSAEMAKIPRTPFVPEDADAVRLPAAFLTDPNGLSLMCRRMGETYFDVYLWLMRESQKGGSPPTLNVDLDRLAAETGNTGPSRGLSRRFVSRALKFLQNDFKLISVVFHENVDAEVTLLPASGETTTVPQNYWTFGWDRRLKFPGKVMYLLGRYYSERSPVSPRWSRSKPDLARDHGLSDSMLDRGTIELKRANLLEVEYAPNPGPGETRLPNEYTPNPLYDPKEWERERMKLVEDHGRDKVDRAARIAVDFYEDCDLGAVEALIGLEDQFGRDKVDRAVRVVGAKSATNPKRCIGYLITVIRDPAAE